MEVSFIDILQLIIPLLVGAVGWGVRIVFTEIRSLKAEQKAEIQSLKDEQKEYVRDEVCKAHRELIASQLSEMRQKCLEKQG